MEYKTYRSISDASLLLAAIGFSFVAWFSIGLEGTGPYEWTVQQIFNVTVIGYYSALVLSVCSVVARFKLITKLDKLTVVQALLGLIAMLPLAHWLVGYLQ